MSDTIISSASNETVKRLRKLLSSGKERRESNTYVAEGTHLVKSFLDSGGRPFYYVCAASALLNDEVAELVERLTELEARPAIVADSLFTSMTSIHAAVGIAIVGRIPEAARVPVPLEHTAVLLEAVQDPGNLGTMLRTSAAAGVKTVILSEGCASPWSPKALRAGMGAQFGLTIYEGADLVEVVRTASIPTLVTTLSPESRSLYDLDLSNPVAWIFGNEGQGVSAALLEAAQVHVSIPQADTPVESLNVAAAAAVCLYEQFRQSVRSE